MSKKENEVKATNNSNNLPEIEVIDATQTKGKICGKFSLVDDAQATEAIEKVDKNKLFAEVSDYFCPIKFDDYQLQVALTQLVESGIMSEEAKLAAIEKAKREFLEAHSEEIAAAQNLTFAEVLSKLQENKTLYQKVLTACKVAELKEENYVQDGKVMIYRANQCQDKDGNNRYTDCTLTTEENGVKFSVNLFVEYREVTTANVLLSIRYYQSKQDAQKRLFNQLTDYRRILTNVAEMVKKAKDNNFAKVQILKIVEEVYG